MRRASDLVDVLSRLGQPPRDLSCHDGVIREARLFVVLTQAEAAAVVTGLCRCPNRQAQIGRTKIQTALYGITRTGAQA
jgi:hypothetical protein